MLHSKLPYQFGQDFLGKPKKKVFFSGPATNNFCSKSKIEHILLQRFYDPVNLCCRVTRSYFFYMCVAIFGQKYGSFSPKILGRILLWPLSSRVGGKQGLSGWATKNFFYGFPWTDSN